MYDTYLLTYLLLDIILHADNSSLDLSPTRTFLLYDLSTVYSDLPIGD